MTVDELISELYGIVADGYNARDEVTYKGQPINSISEMYVDDGTTKWELSDEELDIDDDDAPKRKGIDWEQRLFDLYKDFAYHNWDCKQAYDYAQHIIEQYKRFAGYNKKDDAEYNKKSNADA